MDYEALDSNFHTSRGGNDTPRNVVFCGAHRFFMANTQTLMVHTDFLWLIHRLLWCTQTFMVNKLTLKMHRFFMVQHRLFMANFFDDCIETVFFDKH